MNNNDVIESIENEVKLLKDIIDDPSLLNDEHLSSALKDQKSFANYENKDLSIKSYSLNSHKKHANQILTNGFPYLNSLRKKCLVLLHAPKKSDKKPSKVTLSSLKYKINELQEVNIILKKHNLLLTSLNNHLTEKLDFYILNSKDNEIIYDYQDFKKQLECMVRFIELEV